MIWDRGVDVLICRFADVLIAPLGWAERALSPFCGIQQKAVLREERGVQKAR